MKWQEMFQVNKSWAGGTAAYSMLCDLLVGRYLSEIINII